MGGWVKRGGIKSLGARYYAWITRVSPAVRDFYELVVSEVAGTLNSGRVLDVGTGPGYLPIKIAERLPSVKVIGVDISEDMIKIACRNVENAHLSNQIELLVEDGAETSIAPESIDLVISTASLHHWTRPIQVINEIHRVLKGGREAWIYDVLRDATQEMVLYLRGRYGLLGPILYRIVRSHSSVSMEYVEGILKDPENRFPSYNIERLDLPILKARLRK
ncbi:MAG: class I SAM-dependent methyltransferase [candidate division NC10 bacterium]|nr:class I SAM-dependent methyltransferase [candidate division NC10 bacterium]